ncbi:hypothetical protein P4S72_05695 [Vibrio sp. PP-XX7]
MIISIVISMGSFKHIIYLDKQLAKDLDKLYDSNGQMKSTLFTTIANRYHKYCITYPFIRRRATTDSIRFRIFGVAQLIRFWCWIFGAILALIEK